MITLLTDYGHDGPYVGVCHGAIRRIAPEAAIVDVAHTIEPFNVVQGAVMLADAVPYIPVGVHVAVVDPGVGTSRQAVALRCADGRRYVGPDNGVLMEAATASGVEGAVALASERPASDAGSTFDGRDVFAPAAARLALGTPLSELGEEISTASLARVSVPESERLADGARAMILGRDGFGTLQLAARPDLLDRLPPGRAVAVSGARAEGSAVRGRTFADVEPGELLLYIDSFGHPALAVREGSAAERLGLAPGDWVHIRTAPLPESERD